MDKVYVIRYRAHEFDDLGLGSFDPIFISLDKSKVQEKFEEIKQIKQNGIIDLNKTIKDYFNGVENEDYRVEENTEDGFELWMGNWCYEYYIEEYPLDVDIRYYCIS